MIKINFIYAFRIQKILLKCVEISQIFLAMVITEACQNQKMKI